MPHLVLEYSANILESVQSELLRTMHAVLAEVGPFAFLRMTSRVVRHEIYCLGDGEGDQAFVHLQLAVTPGRSMEIKRAATARLHSFLRERFARSCTELRCTITVEVRELEKESYVRWASGES